MSIRTGKWFRLALAATVAAVFSAAFGSAQSSASDEGKRKIKAKSTPVYPVIARRMNIAGKVKIELVIAPDGHVKNTRVLGGHPLLVQACQDALKEWKFAPGSEETTQIVEFDFHGN